MKIFYPALRLLLVMMVLTGIIYPLFVTGMGKIFFRRQVNGSMVSVNGKTIGSTLVGQKFVSERYFQSRPSAIDYNPMPSGATNFGPTNDALEVAVFQRRAQIDSEESLSSKANIPMDMLFASASGVDPHISPEAAKLQIDRIARARNFTTEQKVKLIELVEIHIELPQWRIFGEPRVNVLRLNLALDRLN